MKKTTNLGALGQNEILFYTITRSPWAETFARVNNADTRNNNTNTNTQKLRRVIYSVKVFREEKRNLRVLKVYVPMRHFRQMVVNVYVLT